ncbi:fatty-acyl-CoA synthase [Marmoricola sp. URHA0025 HA25]
MTHVATAHVPPTAPLVVEGVSAWVRRWAEVNPKGVAVTVVGGASITWQALELRVRALAGHLHDRGVAAGDRVGCLLGSSIDHVVAVHATARIGAVFVPVNIRYAARELAFAVEHVEMALLVVGEEFEKLVADSGTSVPLSRPAEWPAEPDPDPAVETSPAGPRWDDLGFLCFTSGSTGAPRAVQLTHAAFHWMTLDPILLHEIRASDRVITPLPLCYTGGLNALMTMAHAGGELIVIDRFDPEHALAAIERHGATIFHGVPVMAQRMAEAPAWSSTDLTSLRQARVGGAPVSVDLIETWLARGIAITQGYGLTESCGAGLQLHVRDCRRAGKAGRPSYAMSTRVVSRESGSDVEPGTVGELLLRGPQVMTGYWNDPVATEATFRDGWLATGDLVREDGDGLFEIVGRSKELIITGGLNVYPPEVEAALATLPGVVEVAVVGVPSEVWGQEVVAVVVTDPLRPTEPDEVINGCRSLIADYKCPKKVVITSEPLARTASGKVLKRVILDRLTARTEDGPHH